ncbi:hypothetical protein PLESTB_001077100 [Pleodorina starrii]|uniref:Uncharacterized protein n=1 Tax=Pleodorina starrii TaxID=330485 RepID=A0A9W6BQS6_9CHLO|nr:hypothetical protein PLESTM_001182000 [Pleodorina starrii]GLC56180.1 hypothetical protein PLESTB_001077100 [Pleodorina starrii]GLC74934.1 hypothetical protein PLESTF_001574600 [Pleodorina starrii]
MNRLGSLSGLLVRAARSCSRRWASGALGLPAEFAAVGIVGQDVASQARSLHTSLTTCQGAPAEANPSALSAEPPRKYRPLGDKELWHEAWMYEDKFGTEEDPIVVPSLEPERIIGVTDPEDETLVVWGILKDGEPPRQFVENGEFYVLKLVEYVKKVGDVMEEIEGGADKAKLEAK